MKYVRRYKHKYKLFRKYLRISQLRDFKMPLVKNMHPISVTNGIVPVEPSTNSIGNNIFQIAYDNKKRKLPRKLKKQSKRRKTLKMFPASLLKELKKDGIDVESFIDKDGFVDPIPLPSHKEAIFHIDYVKEETHDETGVCVYSKKSHLIDSFVKSMVETQPINLKKEDIQALFRLPGKGEE